MAEVVFRRDASADLAAVYAVSIDQFGSATADHYHDGLQAAVARLATFPQLGPFYPGIRPPARYLAYRRHHVFYDYDGATVWILRILHHAQDALQLLT